MLLLGCSDDFLVPTTSSEDLLEGKEGWCAVQSLFEADCLVCHSTASALGGLDLETSPHAALLGVAAATNPALTLVTPGEPDASFLLRKLSGPLESDEGGLMPPGVTLSEAAIDRVRVWIADGALDDCDTNTPDTDTTTGETDDSDLDPTGYHPTGFADPAVHGVEAKQQLQACTTCHGPELMGQQAAVSCDTCHPAGWRTDCTFCHGEPAEGSGSPPVHISGLDDGLAASFVPHRTHTSATTVKGAYGCEQCHSMPTDVLSAGHLFVDDDTPGQAEAVFAGGISDLGGFDNGSCSNLWCHGNGRRDNGSINHLGSIDTCHDCHPDASSGNDAWERMSGEHKKHLEEGFACADCHATVVSDNTTILAPAQHVDGSVQVAPTQVNWNGTSCTGGCHGESHYNERWR